MEGKGPSDLYAPTVSKVSPVNQVLGAHTKFFRRPLPPLAHLKYIIYILGLTRSRTSTRGYNLRFDVHRQYRDAIKAVVCFASGNFFSQLSTLRSYWLRYCHCERASERIHVYMYTSVHICRAYNN